MRSRRSSCWDVVTIQYKTAVPSVDPSVISRHFALKTSWLTQKIFFRLGSAAVTVLNETSIAVHFYLPFVDDCSTALSCALPHPKISRNWEAMHPFVQRTFDVTFRVPDFVNSTDYSRMRCHNPAVFPRRWCECRNLVYFGRRFFFLSPAHFEVPEPFIVPGPRAPPFDKEGDQLVIEPIVLNDKISTLPQNLSVVDDFYYRYGVFHNYYMLWHTVFDFMIPLYHFIKLLNGTDTVAHRRIYVRSDGVWMFHSMMRIFSLERVFVIGALNAVLLMPRAVIGIEELELDVDPKRSYDDSIGFHYNFNRSTALGMREDVLRTIGIPVDAVGYEGRPLALLIDRGHGARNIRNSDEIRQAMVAGCPHCRVEVVRYHTMNPDHQVYVTARASVLVGFHGSGLTHTVWMTESRPNHTTHMVEILPYKYTCRDWYATAARVAGVQYWPVMNKRPTEGVTDKELIKCWNNPRLFPTLGCHDKLRDQSTLVEIDTFNETWARIADALKSTIVPANPDEQTPIASIPAFQDL
jgi:hypothetical protein